MTMLHGGFPGSLEVLLKEFFCQPLSRISLLFICSCQHQSTCPTYTLTETKSSVSPIWVFHLVNAFPVWAEFWRYTTMKATGKHKDGFLLECVSLPSAVGCDQGAGSVAAVDSLLPRGTCEWLPHWCLPSAVTKYLRYDTDYGSDGPLFQNLTIQVTQLTEREGERQDQRGIICIRVSWHLVIL